MAQINLLKQNTSESFFSKFSPKLLMQFFAGVLLCLVMYYGFLFFQSKSIDKKILDTQTSIQNEKNVVASVPNKEELFVRQQQLKNLETLIGGHLYWSQFFKPLADVTLKNATYTSIAVDSNNQLVLNVQVPSLGDLDKYLQVFNLSEFNKNFNNLRVGGYTKVSNASSTAYQFMVRMDYDPSLLNYKPATSN